MAHEKYIPKEADLSGRLAHCVEEVGEALAALGKVQRYGFYSYNPNENPDTAERNHQWLLRELDDARQAIIRLEYTMVKHKITMQHFDNMYIEMK